MIPLLGTNRSRLMLAGGAESLYVAETCCVTAVWTIPHRFLTLPGHLCHGSSSASREAGPALVRDCIYFSLSVPVIWATVSWGYFERFYVQHWTYFILIAVQHMFPKLCLRLVTRLFSRLEKNKLVKCLIDIFLLRSKLSHDWATLHGFHIFLWKFCISCAKRLKI